MGVVAPDAVVSEIEARSIRSVPERVVVVEAVGAQADACLVPFDGWRVTELLTLRGVLEGTLEPGARCRDVDQIDFSPGRPRVCVAPAPASANAASVVPSTEPVPPTP